MEKTHEIMENLLGTLEKLMINTKQLKHFGKNKPLQSADI